MEIRDKVINYTTMQCVCYVHNMHSSIHKQTQLSGLVPGLVLYRYVTASVEITLMHVVTHVLYNV